MLEIGAHEEHELEPRNAAKKKIKKKKERERERKRKKMIEGGARRVQHQEEPQRTRRIFYDFTIFLRLDLSSRYSELTRDRKISV